jgi:hypothetical protein
MIKQYMSQVKHLEYDVTIMLALKSSMQIGEGWKPLQNTREDSS